MMREQNKNKLNIKEEEVNHIAHLARLDITLEEKVKYGEELGKILNYVNMLQEIETEDIEATFSVLPQYNVFREDEIKPSLSPSEVLLNAPEKEENFFKMPKILRENE